MMIVIKSFIGMSEKICFVGVVIIVSITETMVGVAHDSL